MKRTTLAFAALAVCGAACAQSSVTLFGIVDATVQRVAHSGGASVTRLANSGYQSSRLGFRGTEDLGGGMSASFWLEAGMNNDDGRGLATNTNNQAAGASTGQGLTFGRRSTVSLAGGWGELRLGRDFTPQLWNLNVFDPFNNVGAGATLPFAAIITGVTAVRASNSIGYFFPRNLGGFYGQVQHYLGENASNGAATENDGNGWGARLGYSAGALNIAGAVSRTQYAAGDVRQNNLGASWKFPAGTLTGLLSSDRNGTTKARGYMVAGTVPVGVGLVRLSYSVYKVDPVAGVNNPRSAKVALGYVHNLSKRTALYTTHARVRNSSGAVVPAVSGAAGAPGANASSTGWDFGIRHSF